MNRAQRRAASSNPHVQRIDALERHRIALEEELRQQAAEIRMSTPAPGETREQALVEVETSIADLSGDQYGLVAGSALEVLRALRDDLAAAIARPN